MKRSKVSGLLFVGSIVGVVATAVVSAVCATKAREHLEEDCSFTLAHSPEPEDEMKVKVQYAKFVAKETWKYYIPTAAVAAGTLGCIVAGKRMDMKAIATMTALSSSSMYLVNKYRDKIKEYANEEILSQIDKEIADERKQMKDLPVHIGNEEKAYIQDEHILMYDRYTGAWFDTTRLGFTTAAMLVNQRFAYGSQVPLEMFYKMQGAELPDDYKNCIWDWEDFNDGYIWIEFYHEPKYTSDGKMYYELTYNIDPYNNDIDKEDLY